MPEQVALVEVNKLAIGAGKMCLVEYSIILLPFSSVFWMMYVL